MNCDEALRLIHLDAEGELSSAEAALLQAHLVTCVQCASEADLVRMTHPFLARLRVSTPGLARPEDLTRAIMSRVVEDARRDATVPDRSAFQILLDVLAKPAVRYAYGALLLFFVSLFVIQQTDTLRSMEALSMKLAESRGGPAADIRYSVPLDEARAIIGRSQLEPLVANTPVRISNDRVFLQKSDIYPWTQSFSSRLTSRLLQSSGTPAEQLSDIIRDLQKSATSSLSLRAGGTNQ